MKKTILSLIGYCATISAMAQSINSSSLPINPVLDNDRINYIEQGLKPSQQNNQVKIRQGGNAASYVIQNGSNGRVDVNQERYYGNDNFVNIRQFGTINSVYSLQEGFNNRAVVLFIISIC